jgi:FkbM family methyltransferase
MLRGSASVSLAEPELLGLPSLVRTGDVCFDIGAAYGMYSFTLAHLVGTPGAVHSFEPQPKPHRILAAGVRGSGLDHLHPHHSAMGREPGTLEMALPVKFGVVPVHGHAHVNDGVAQKRPSTRFSRMRAWSTPIHSVDEFCDEHSIDRVHFMKVDVEGFEPTVIRGAQRVIAEHRPTLLLEIEDRHLCRYDTTAAEFTDSLRGIGYSMYTWNKREWTRAEKVTPQTRNYLFATEEAWNR